MPLPEKLKMELTHVAASLGIKTQGKNPIEIVAEAKKRANSEKDEKVLRKVCEHWDLDYERLPAE